MAKITVLATLTRTYEVSVDADDAEQAIASLNEWIGDDFAPYQTGAKWEFVAN